MGNGCTTGIIEVEVAQGITMRLRKWGWHRALCLEARAMVGEAREVQGRWGSDTIMLTQAWQWWSGTYGAVRANTFKIHSKHLVSPYNHGLHEQLWRRRFLISLMTSQILWLWSNLGQPRSAPRKPSQQSPMNILSKSTPLAMVKTLVKVVKTLSARTLSWNFDHVLQILFEYSKNQPI
jgi:hypothetical protein